MKKLNLSVETGQVHAYSPKAWVNPEKQVEVPSTFF